MSSLIARGAGVNWRDPQFGSTALYTAAYQGHSVCVRLLLEAREEYARRCEGCRVTSYVLPGQEETCRHCQGPLFRRRHTPPPAQREQLARMVEERLSSGRVAQLNAVPEETPPPTRCQAGRRRSIPLPDERRCGGTRGTSPRSNAA